MNKLTLRAIALSFVAVTVGACIAAPDDESEEEGVEAVEADDVEEGAAEDVAPAIYTAIPKCGPKERWCRCGGCTNIELKCNPYCGFDE